MLQPSNVLMSRYWHTVPRPYFSCVRVYVSKAMYKAPLLVPSPNTYIRFSHVVGDFICLDS